MKGTNELKLSQAGMIEALQAWIDTTFTEAHRQVVTEVKAAGDGRFNSGSGTDFLVTLSDPPEKSLTNV